MSPLARFRADERAVEGLPIRLVVGVVVGVASLSVMLNMVIKPDNRNTLY